MHIIYISTLFVTVFGMIMHVFEIWEFSVWSQASVQDLLKSFCKKSETNRKNYALRQSLICGLILESSKLTHCLHNQTIYSVFDMIIHVLWFLSFESDHNLLCGISRKVLAENLRQIKKNHALKHPLIWGQMSKSSKYAYYIHIHVIYDIFNMIMHVLRFGSFQSDHKLLCRICRKVFAKKSKTNRKNCALRHPLIWGQMWKCSK